jgi:hypothetical protein
MDEVGFECGLEEWIQKPRQMTDNGGAMLLVMSKRVRGKNCKIVTPIEFEGWFGLGRDGQVRLRDRGAWGSGGTGGGSLAT